MNFSQPPTEKDVHLVAAVQRPGRVLRIFFALATGLILAGWLAYAPLTAQSYEWVKKVDPWVLETTAGGGSSEFVLFLREQADLSAAASFPSKESKGRFVFETLRNTALRTQAPLLATLRAGGFEHKSFWVANMVWVRGDSALVAALARRPDVAHIYANPSVRLQPPDTPTPASPEGQDATVEWNISLVRAPEVWDQGFTGQGVVIGGQDTGYDWDHPALRQQYRGWNGVTATHAYNWHDAIHTFEVVCGSDSPEPCDDNGHGTHTMGTMVGDDHGNNRIGMAPDARWIGCRNMRSGWGTPATYAECYEWFIAPTDLGDRNPDPSKAPHVINNSWSCPPSEGCTDPEILRSVVDNVRAAGILTVHSAGNSGPSCRTIQDPAAIYDASFTVGATTGSDLIAGFSSRGPASSSNGQLLKPDISAPGVSVRSSIPRGIYGTMSGTSMAAPVVAGAAALLISSEPSLAGDIDLIENLIQRSAVPKTTSQGCGGDGPDDVPNHVYGYGRVDAMAAVERAKNRLVLSKTATPLLNVGESISYSLTVENQHIFPKAHGLELSDTLPTGTTFITATPPFVFDGQVVTWHLSELDAGHAWRVSLVVAVPLSFQGSNVKNLDYWVTSEELDSPIAGDTVTSLLGPHYVYYFPFLSGP